MRSQGLSRPLADARRRGFKVSQRAPGSPMFCPCGGLAWVGDPVLTLGSVAEDDRKRLGNRISEAAQAFSFPAPNFPASVFELTWGAAYTKFSRNGFGRDFSALPKRSPLNARDASIC